MSLSKVVHVHSSLHLRVVPPGHLLRRASTPKRFCLSAIFIQPGFYFLCREVAFSCVFCLCFPVVHIHIYIFFIYFFHCTVGYLICAEWFLWDVAPGLIVQHILCTYTELFEVYISVSSLFDSPGL